MTLSMWVFGAASQPQGDVVFSMYHDDGPNDIISVMRIGTPIGTDAHNFWQVGEADNFIDVYLAEVEDSKYKGQWNHYIYTKNAESGMMDIYINGVFWGGMENDYSSMGTIDAYLGSARGSQSYNGMIDNVRLYDTAMNATTAAGLYGLELASPPVVNDQTQLVAKNGFKRIPLTSSSLTTNYTIDQYPAHGELTGTGSNLVYTPDTDYEGADSFSFYGTDHGLVGNTATVNINVTELAAFISIPLSAMTTNYHVTGDEAVKFRSTGVTKNYDVDGDNAYGTAGYYFYGNGENNTSNSDDKPSWVTSVSSLADNIWASDTYTVFDNPTAGITSDAADWTVTGIGLVDTAGTTGDLWAELLTFTVSADAPRNFRLGIMAGNNNFNSDGRWDAKALRLSIAGGIPVEVSGLDVSTLGMIFFDVSLPNNSAGVFTIEGQTRHLGSNTKGPSIAGITFDHAFSLDAWLDTFPATSGNGINDDPDNDGLSNILEYVLSGDPTNSDNVGIKLKEEGDDFVFSFNRLAISAVDTRQVFQYCLTIQPNDWTDLNITDPKAAEVTIGEAVNGFEEVSVTIHKNLAAGGKLFGRLQVTLP